MIYKAFVIVCVIGGVECKTYSQDRDYSNLDVCMAAAIKLKQGLSTKMPALKFVPGCMDVVAETEIKAGNPRPL